MILAYFCHLSMCYLERWQVTFVTAWYWGHAKSLRYNERKLNPITDLWINANKCISSVVELFFERDHNALKLTLGLLSDISCNLEPNLNVKWQLYGDSSTTVWHGPWWQEQAWLKSQSNMANNKDNKGTRTCSVACQLSVISLPPHMEDS